MMDATIMMLPSTVALSTIWAYLDPGAGSVVLQVLLAGMLSSMFFMKSWIRQFRDSLLFRDKKA
jgi:hypothetical protein